MNRKTHLFTIGYQNSHPESFFNTIRANDIECVIDVRLYPTSTHFPFVNIRYLPYFLPEICKCGYEYEPLFTPTPKILRQYKQDGNWDSYKTNFVELLHSRKVFAKIPDHLYDYCCFLCYESDHTYCHRNLVAHYIRRVLPDVEVQITHLKPLEYFV
jgi:uncharacterized protein (DUF488 family)